MVIAKSLKERLQNWCQSEDLQILVFKLFFR